MHFVAGFFLRHFFFFFFFVVSVLKMRDAFWVVLPSEGGVGESQYRGPSNLTLGQHSHFMGTCAFEI